MNEAHRLSCIDLKLARVLELLEPVLSPQGLELGNAVVRQLTAEQGGAVAQFDFFELGRAASSFTVTNLGNTAALYFRSNALQAERADVGPIYLLPQTSRTFTRPVERLEVSPTGDGAVWVQVDVL